MRRASRHSPTAALSVPEAAVVSAGSDDHVFLVREGHAWRTEVILGELADGRYPVLDGLRGGEVLVVSEVEALSDGAAIRIETNE